MQKKSNTEQGSNLPIIFALVVVLGIIITFILMSLPAPASSPSLPPTTMENGQQIINVTARGGYTPSIINAQADTPTILRLKTNNSFDCSVAFAIPSLGINQMLPMTGTTDIDIGPQTSGSTLVGTCSMGMYSFKMNFN